MKGKLLKVSALILAVCTLMCGCNKGNVSDGGNDTYVADTNLNEPGVFPICKEPIKLTVGIPKDAHISDYVNNAYTKLLKEKSNIELEFEYFPATAIEARQKLDLMVSSGGAELPDILVGFDVSLETLYQYGSAGIVKDLSYYYENCAYYINDIYEKHPDLKEKELKSPDGKIYGIPRLSDNHFVSVGVYLWMYEPWLEKLGLKEPETVDELKEVLRAFKEKDPNGNGIRDEIPFLGATDDQAGKYLMLLGSPFLPVNTSKYYFYSDEKGKVHAAYMEDEWKDMLKYLNELCSEGLFSPSTFTTTSEQFNQIARNRETLVGCMTVAPYIFESGDKRMDEYKVIGPIAGPDGTKRVITNNDGYSCAPGAFVITKNCKYPEAAFRLGDYMCSEEASMSAKLGEKDVDWTAADEGSVSNYEELGIPAFYKKLNVLGDVHNKTWGSDVWAGYTTTDINLGEQKNPEKQAAKWITEQKSKFPRYYENRYPYILNLSYLEEDTKRADELKYATSEYVNDMIAKFILGRENIDEKWEEYKKTLKSLGVEELIEIQQRAYDNANKK